MTTLRKLIKGKKHRKITKKNTKQITSKFFSHNQKGGQDKNDDEIDIANDDLLLENNNNENKSAKTGAYNKNNSNGELTGIAKELQKTQGGLSFQYPGTVNITQEQALQNKLNNVREEGFPGLNINIKGQFKPKINYQKMYESDLLSAGLVIPKDEFNTNSEKYKSDEQV